MTDVFISYARADRNRVRHIAHALTAEGFNVWWDPEIKPGAQWNAAIRKALENAACVVTCWSKKSPKSQWVLAETTHGNARQALVPVMIQACEPPIPYNMMQAADLTGWRGDGSDPAWQGVLEQVRRLVEAKRRLAAAAPPPGEAYGATRAATTAATAVVDEPFAYTPSPRRFGPRLGQMLLGGVVVTAVLTAGVFLAPRVMDRFAPGERDAATTPAPQTPDYEVDFAPSPAPVPSDLAPGSDAPAPPADPGATPAPVSTTPTAPPAATPTTPSAPSGPAADLDTCVNRLIALCPGYDQPVSGFRSEGRLSANEGQFLSNLQIAADPPTTDAVTACRSIIQRRTSGATPANRRTLFDQACASYVTPPASPPPQTGGGQAQPGGGGSQPGLGEAIIDALPDILGQTTANQGRTGSANIPPGSLLDLGSGQVGRGGDVGLYSASRRVASVGGFALAANDGVGVAAMGSGSVTQADCADANYGAQAPISSGQTFCVRRRNGTFAAITAASDPSENGVSVRYRVWD